MQVRQSPTPLQTERQKTLRQARVTEVDVAVHVLNRMLELGRPSYVRLA